MRLDHIGEKKKGRNTTEAGKKKGEKGIRERETGKTSEWGKSTVKG